MNPTCGTTGTKKSALGWKGAAIEDARYITLKYEWLAGINQIK